MSANPYIGLARAAVQFLAGAVSNSQDTRRPCWGNLTTLRALMDQCQILLHSYSRAYKNPSSKHLIDDAVTRSFTAVLNYEISVIVKYSELWKSNAIFLDKLDCQPQRYHEEVGKQESNLMSLYQSLGRADQIDSTESMQRALEGITQTTELQLQIVSDQNKCFMASASRTDRMQILTWISAIKFAEMQQALSKVRCQETTEWILEEPTYLSRHQSNVSETIWIHDFMGSGKGWLVSFIVDHFGSGDGFYEDQNHMCFYCVGSDQAGLAQTDNVANLLQSLLQQLAAADQPTTILYFIIHHYETERHEALLTDVQCIEFSQNLLANFSLSVLVLDGLDDAPKRIQLDLTTYPRDTEVDEIYPEDHCPKPTRS